MITSDLTKVHESKKNVRIILQNISSSTSLLKLYATVIRPSLEYACQVWDPHLVKDIEKLDGVQKFALRICLKKWKLDYSSLLLISNLHTVANRRSSCVQCLKL